MSQKGFLEVSTQYVEDCMLKSEKEAILGRHFGCRPLDPTLDIWSNFSHLTFCPKLPIVGVHAHICPQGSPWCDKPDKIGPNV